MSSQRVSPVASLVLGASCLLGGCTGRPDRPATVPVRGSVSYQGKPVAGATVAFLAQGAPRPAIGTTDADGKFHLTMFEPDDGAVPGEHLVTVEKFSEDGEANLEALEESAAGKDDSAAIEQAMQMTAQQMEQSRRVDASLPRKYATRQTSDLRFTVVDGENDIQIELID